MSLETSSARLTTAAETFAHRWLDVRTTWRDARAAAFERQYVAAIESAVRAARSAMEQMNAVLTRARQECE